MQDEQTAWAIAHDNSCQSKEIASNKTYAHSYDERRYWCPHIMEQAISIYKLLCCATGLSKKNVEQKNAYNVFRQQIFSA